MNQTENIAEVPERVFFVKCRPQGADLIDLVRSEQRVFIGYPPWRRGLAYDRSDLASCVVDLRAAGGDWRCDVENYHQSMQTNYRFAKSVSAGWIVAIPRPGDGVCWIAEITDRFELVSNPSWRQRYLEMRTKQGLTVEDEASHIGDVIQSWRFQNVVAVPFARIPRWITYRLLSRSTIGEIHGVPALGLNAHETLKRFLDESTHPTMTVTSDLEEIRRRLITFISPNAFEHLVVALHQLEYPDESWWHIGGAGDGGSDGLGYTNDWVLTCQIQCKWFFSGHSCSEVFAARISSNKRVLASLIHGQVDRDLENVEFWGLEEIAVLIKKHAVQLPVAKSLRIAS